MGPIQSSPAPFMGRRVRFFAFAAILSMTALLQACGTVSPPDATPGARNRPGQSYNTYASVVPPGRQYDLVGVASWYGKPYHGRRTASGEVYNMYQMTAAHPSLPFGTRVVVTNLENGRSAIVRINDRGPFVHGRVIDLSRKAASQLGFLGQGVTRVGVRVIASSQG